jgi:hypothetical protein
MGMRRYLLVALWPAGLAAIGAATVLAARRAQAAAPAAPAEPAGDAEGQPVYSPPGRSDASATPGDVSWPSDLLRLGAISAAGGCAGYTVMRLIGPAIINHGQAIDEPIHRWTNDNQVLPWAAVLERLNKVGNTWTTWGAAGAAAACLGVTWPRQKWLPPATLGAAILVDHYATLALRHTLRRVGPPSSPLGTYPAGGPDRVVLFYGLIAHMLWREFSGSQRGKIWAIGSVTALGFHQAYCREYLSKHWTTDIISGLFYGGVLLAPFIVAIRLIAGPVRERTTRLSRADTSAAGGPVASAPAPNADVVRILRAERRPGQAG